MELLETLIKEVVSLRRRVGALETLETPVMGARVFRSTAQSFAHNTLAAIAFDTEVCDTDGCWSSGAATKLRA